MYLPIFTDFQDGKISTNGWTYLIYNISVHPMYNIDNYSYVTDLYPLIMGYVMGIEDFS